MTAYLRWVRRRLALAAPLALLSLVLAGCALPWAAPRPRGLAVERSPGCHCRFSYPASWYFTPANGDYSKPLLGLASYDNSSEDHRPVPPSYAEIGVDWRSDPIGQLYLATATQHFSSAPAHQLTVAGRPATSFSYWTAPPGQGGFFVEHVYLFVPWYQVDYDVWLHAVNHGTADVAAYQRVFQRLLRSLAIVPPNAVP